MAKRNPPTPLFGPIRDNAGHALSNIEGAMDDMDVSIRRQQSAYQKLKNARQQTGRIVNTATKRVGTTKAKDEGEEA